MNSSFHQLACALEARFAIEEILEDHTNMNYNISYNHIKEFALNPPKIKNKKVREIFTDLCKTYILVTEGK